MLTTLFLAGAIAHAAPEPAPALPPEPPEWHHYRLAAARGAAIGEIVGAVTLGAVGLGAGLYATRNAPELGVLVGPAIGLPTGFVVGGIAGAVVGHGVAHGQNGVLVGLATAGGFAGSLLVGGTLALGSGGVGLAVGTVCAVGLPLGLAWLAGYKKPPGWTVALAPTAQGATLGLSGRF